jgi:hypothetical protein
MIVRLANSSLCQVRAKAPRAADNSSSTFPTRMERWAVGSLAVPDVAKLDGRGFHFNDVRPRPLAETKYTGLHHHGESYSMAGDSSASISVLGKRPFWCDESDEDSIPSHMIDAVARSLLHKRPRLTFTRPELSDSSFYSGHFSPVEIPVSHFQSRENVFEQTFHGSVDANAGFHRLAFGPVAPVQIFSEATTPMSHFSTEEACMPQDKPAPHSTSFRKYGDSGCFVGFDNCFEDVIEVSSEGGSCQPSPEVPVLSLCDDFDIAPLELGNPAMNRSLHHSSHTMIAVSSEPVTIANSVAASVGDPVAYEVVPASLSFPTCHVCGAGGGACMGACEQVVGVEMESSDILDHLDGHNGGLWNTIHSDAEGSSVWW